MSQTVTRDNYRSGREAILLCLARCVKKAGVTTDPSRRKTTGKSHPQIGPGRVDSEWNPAKGFTVMMLHGLNKSYTVFEIANTHRPRNC